MYVDGLPVDVVAQVLTECPDYVATQLLKCSRTAVLSRRQQLHIASHWPDTDRTITFAAGRVLRKRWIHGPEYPPDSVDLAQLDALVRIELGHSAPVGAKTTTASQTVLDPTVVLDKLKEYIAVEHHAPTLPDLALFGLWTERQTEAAINRLRKIDLVRRHHESETYAPYKEPRQHAGYGRVAERKTYVYGGENIDV